RGDHLLHRGARFHDPAALHLFRGEAGCIAGDQRAVDADPGGDRRRADPGGLGAPVGREPCQARGRRRGPRGTRRTGTDGGRWHMKTGGLRRPAALPVVSLLAAALLLAACGSGGAGGGSAGGGERVLNVFNWSEYLPDSVLAAFEAEFGVRVNYDVYSSNEELMAKLQAGGQGLYDVAVPSDFTAATMIELGLVEPLDFDRLPNVTQYLVDDLRDPVYAP